MRSALQSRLSAEQWQKLVERTCQRVADLDAERRGSSWWTDRERFERVAASDFSHRKAGEGQELTIFDKSNFSTQIVRSVARSMLARTSKDIFGSKPWFAVQPQGPLDAVLSRQIHKHAGWKLDAARYTVAMKEALATALDLGEVAIKTTWKVEEDTFETYSAHLYDPAAKEPVRGPDGELLLDTDATFEETVLDEATGEEMPTGRRVFEKAPEIAIPDETNGYEWKDEAVEETQRLYYGPKCKPLHWKDVFWPINAPCLSEADFVFHRYDTTPDELRARFPGENGKENKDLEAFLEEVKGDGANPKAEGSQAKTHEGEPEIVNTDLEAVTISVAECYFKTSILGNGKTTRVWMLVHEKLQKAIWGDYLATISPRSQYPIQLLPINRVKGRAYGRGLYAMYEMAADIVDKLVNAVIHRNEQHANPTKIYNAHLTVEGSTNLEVGPGKVMTAKNQGVRAGDILSFVEMPDLDNRSWQLFEFFMQLIQSESGVMNPNEAAVGAMPQNQLATGINAQTEISGVLHLYTLEEVRDWLTPQLRYVIELIYFKQDEDETFEYLEGEANEVLRLSDAQILRKLPLNVEILLSRSKRQELREAALAAIPVAQGYYTQLSQVVGPIALEWMAKRLLPLYTQSFRGLDIDRADTYFPDEAEIDQAIEIQKQAAQAQADAQAEAATAEGGEVVSEVEEPLPSNVVPDATPV